MTGAFEAHIQACGLPSIRLHHTRHVACSLLLAGGVPIEIVQMILGHSSPSVTRRIYAHVMKKRPLSRSRSHRSSSRDIAVHNRCTKTPRLMTHRKTEIEETAGQRHDHVWPGAESNRQAFAVPAATRRGRPDRNSPLWRLPAVGGPSGHATVEEFRRTFPWCGRSVLRLPAMGSAPRRSMSLCDWPFSWTRSPRTRPVSWCWARTRHDGFWVGWSWIGCTVRR